MAGPVRRRTPALTTPQDLWHIVASMWVSERLLSEKWFLEQHKIKECFFEPRTRTPFISRGLSRGIQNKVTWLHTVVGAPVLYKQARVSLVEVENGFKLVQSGLDDR